VQRVLCEVNMGATAIGTGLNAPVGYANKCTEHLAAISGLPIYLAEDLIEANMRRVAWVCVRASRVAVGRVGRNVELDDDKLGFVASLDLNPQKARVLLRLALLKTWSNADLQRLFEDY